MRFCIIETILGWIGLVLSPSGLRAVTLPRRDRDAALQEIPYGRRRSYGWLAARAGRPRAARAVGQAMAANPWPILVPCHRVISSNGHLGGYGGGLDMKERLLLLEGVIDG